MATTKISNIIVPDVFNPYVIQRTSELMNLYLGGIISVSEELNALAKAGGKTVNMPFWNDLVGDDEILSDSGALTPVATSAGQDVAVMLMRGKAWSVNDLAKALSGDDPMKAIADLVAGYKVRKLQTSMINALKGAFADNVANDSGDMTEDIAIEAGNAANAANLISAEAVIDAVTGTMGDAWDKISGMAMHSTVFSRLQKQQVIDYIAPSDSDVKIPYYLDKRVIVDDSCPRVAGSTSGYKYTTYFFGEGAVGFGDGAAPVPVETDRDSLASNDLLIARWHSLVHPRGIAFTSSSVAGASPTNAELAAAGNWNRVYERKNVRLAQLITNG